MIGIILLIFLNVFILQPNRDNAIQKTEIEKVKMKDSTSEKVIVDSDYSLAEALDGIIIPPAVKKSLIIINVQYYSFDGKIHQGQVVISEDLKSDIEKIFKEIQREKFPIAKAIPIVYYGWDDEKSMEDNNTSAFNYRVIAGTKKLSNHSFGTAIDINPLLNPYIRKDLHQPRGSVYNPSRSGTISNNSLLVKAFRTLGWDWGGDWKDRKDYQHFEKPGK